MKVYTQDDIPKESKLQRYSEEVIIYEDASLFIGYYDFYIDEWIVNTLTDDPIIFKWIYTPEELIKNKQNE